MRHDISPRSAIYDANEAGPIIASLLNGGLHVEAYVRLMRLKPPDRGDVLNRLPDVQQRQLNHHLSPDTIGSTIDCLAAREAADIASTKRKRLPARSEGM